MRITLTMIAILVSLSATARAELVAPQSMTTSFDVPSLASAALSRDSQTLNANIFATTPSTASNSETVTTVSNIVNKTIDSGSASNSSEDSTSSILDRLSTVASNTVRRFQQNGIASWYGHQFNGRKTANGERFDMNAMTAAHRSLPLSCFIRVTNKENGKSVIVRVNDRGPYAGNRILDLSYGAAKQLGIVNQGMGNVTIERVSAPN